MVNYLHIFSQISGQHWEQGWWELPSWSECMAYGTERALQNLGWAAESITMETLSPFSVPNFLAETGAWCDNTSCRALFNLFPVKWKSTQPIPSYQWRTRTLHHCQGYHCFFSTMTSRHSSWTNNTQCLSWIGPEFNHRSVQSSWRLTLTSESWQHQCLPLYTPILHQAPQASMVTSLLCPPFTVVKNRSYSCSFTDVLQLGASCNTLFTPTCLGLKWQAPWMWPIVPHW